MALTGKFNLRQTFWGKVVLQVEEEVQPMWGRSKPLKRRWRDAKVLDLASPALRPLLDLRNNPYLVRTAPTSAREAHPPQGTSDGLVVDDIDAGRTSRLEIRQQRSTH